MGSTFFGLNTATSALVASQLALDTAAHNTANASTEGYSRQRVNLVASPPFTYPSFNRSGTPGQVGTGVTVSGDHPNDLADQRDQLLDQLHAILPVTVEPQADGTVSVLVGGTDLVTNDRARTIATVDNGSGHLIPQWGDGSALPLGQGQLGALVAFRDTTMVGYQTKLDQLASGIADAVNALHTS